MVLPMLRGALSQAARGAVARSTPLAYNLQARAFADRKGTVKFFNAERGFGFIQSEEQDIFVHYSGIQSQGGFRSLAEGEEVEFDVETDQNGKLRALNVTGPNGAPVKGQPRPERDY
eukprot:SRR837773.20146.p2 GENE.SRR837773.20146~~SRR837773.20146.p2  ORF type:complete len:128 (-),score=38.77 SRR837773.20146:73-423(-)